MTTTQTQYDALERPLSVTYSDGTASKSYSYDVPAQGTNSTNVLGRLAQQQAAASPVGPAVEAFSYDAMGRITQVITCLPSTCGKSAAVQNYTYDYAGNMTGATDGVGASLVYGYTPANENAGIAALAGAAYPASVLSNVVNGPNGPTSYQLGNGLFQVNQYDNLGRRTGGWVCSNSSSPGCAGGTQLYGFTVGISGSRVNGACDTVLGSCGAMNYDSFNRLTARTATSGSALNDTWTYDRYGNRWNQTVSPGGYQAQLSFNPANNQAVGFSYDAAGNLLSDTAHGYSYDAEGNMTAVDGGSTARYFYDAANHRVRTEIDASAYELLFNLGGQKVVIWDAKAGAVVEEDTHLGAQPLAVYLNGSLSFEHQDWLGTERLLTSSTGSQLGSYGSLPFGDGFADNGADIDPYHFAGLDHDYESGLDHAQYRSYGNAGGRWLSPDPYSGSYDWANPQSLNRYSYALNNPLSFTDPSGLFTNGAYCGSSCSGGNSGDGGFISFFLDLGEGIASLFGGGPSFHGSLTPRPAAPSKHFCGAGAYAYGGRSLDAGPVNGFAGGILEADTNSGISKGALFELGGGEGYVGGIGKIVSPSAGGLGSTNLVYGGVGGEIPGAHAAAGLVGFSSGGGVFGEISAGGREVGIGLYLDIAPTGGCLKP